MLRVGVELPGDGDRDVPLLQTIQPADQRVVEVHQHERHCPTPGCELSMILHPLRVLAQETKNAEHGEATSGKDADENNHLDPQEALHIPNIIKRNDLAGEQQEQNAKFNDGTNFVNCFPNHFFNI